MAEQLKQLGLMVGFGLLGALATLLSWYAFAEALSRWVPREFLELSVFSVGLLGPLTVWMVVILGTRLRSGSRMELVRVTAGAGLAVVAATQLAFYVPLGFMCLAFHLSP